MSATVDKKVRNSCDILERMLNKTTLTTQRVAHDNIIELGQLYMKSSHVDINGLIEDAVKTALEKADRKHTREMKAALTRAKEISEATRTRDLANQKQYYERFAKRVAIERDKAEEEHIRQLTKKMEREKEEAMERVRQQCERQKADAVEEACIEATRKLKAEAALQREKAVADALAHAREKFKERLQSSIADTRRECEERAAREAERVAKLHAQELNREHNTQEILYKKLLVERNHKERIEKDFRDLQSDYQRFMNLTDGRYHSDYMMLLRDHGMKLSEKRISVVRFGDINPEKKDIQNEVLFM